MGVKLPDSLKAKRAVLFEELAKDAMEYSKAHKKSHRGDISNLSSLLPVFGKIKAEEITPQIISAYFQHPNGPKASKHQQVSLHHVDDLCGRYGSMLAATIRNEL
jgi:hypothetical protein